MRKNSAPMLAQELDGTQMNTFKPALLVALMALPMLGVAEAQSKREVREDRREYRQAVRRGDFTTAQQKANEIQQNRYNLQQRRNNNNNGWNNGRNNNSWNNNNNWNNGWNRNTPYNNNYNYRYNNYRTW